MAARGEGNRLLALKKEGTTLPPRVLEAARSSDAVNSCPLDYEYPPRDRAAINPAGIVADQADLYAISARQESRHVRRAYRQPVDLVITAKDTEGFYADRRCTTGSRRVHAT